MKPTEKQIKQAKEILKAAGYLEPIWHKADIKTRIIDNFGRKTKITNKLLNEIISEIEDNHDANNGINWDVIDTAIENVINPINP